MQCTTGDGSFEHLDRPVDLPGEIVLTGESTIIAASVDSPINCEHDAAQRCLCVLQMVSRNWDGIHQQMLCVLCQR